MKKAVLRNFGKLTGKHLCQGLFFNKVAGLRPATLLKKDSGTGAFLLICEISENTFFTEHLWTTVSGTRKMVPLQFLLLQYNCIIHCLFLINL